MSRLSEIPIRVDFVPASLRQTDGISPAGVAILSEIESLLEQYVERWMHAWWSGMRARPLQLQRN